MGRFWLRLCTNGLNGRLNQTLASLVKKAICTKGSCDIIVMKFIKVI